MSAKTKGAAPIAVTALNSTGRSKIAVAIRDAAVNIGRSGALICTVCNAALSVAGGTKLSDGDIDAIMKQVAGSEHMREMKPATRASVLSRWRTVLGVYSLIPEAEKQLRAKTGRAAWHDVMMIATKLKRNPDIKAAVASTAAWMNNAGRSGTKKAKTKAQAIGIAKRAIKALAKLPHLGRAFQKELLALAVKHEIMQTAR